MGADLFANPLNAIHRIIDILSGIIPRSDNQNLGKIVLNACHLERDGQTIVFIKEMVRDVSSVEMISFAGF
jgi:hypothetical protein